MFKANQIRDVHLEISSLCNAECPLCPRNFKGHAYNNGYQETNLSLTQSQHIFTPSFLKQLKKIWINGNFGDFVMNPESLAIVAYFRQHNPQLIIEVSTNGGARDTEFWSELAAYRPNVHFCIDGLEDTHSLYRRNTVYDTVIRNAKTFIKAGGKATWKMIPFDHNRHQIDQCKTLSRQLGFSRFLLADQGRNIGPVFNRKGEYLYDIGNYQGEKNFQILFHGLTHKDLTLPEIAKTRKIKSHIRCFSKERHSIYVAANGDVSPCCWMGFSPKSYGKGDFHQPINQQLKSLIAKNNALEYPLEECIEWFDKVKESWQKGRYEDGRLLVCDDYCGS